MESVRRTSLLLGLLFLAAPRAGERERPEVWQVIEHAVVKSGHEGPVRIVLEHMAGVPVVRRLANRLSRVERALVEPWTPPSLAEELRDLLADPLDERGDGFAALPAGIAAWLDLTLPAPDDDPGLAELERRLADVRSEEVTGRSLLEALSSFLATAHAILAEGLIDLEGGPRELLFARHADFAAAYRRTHDPAAEPDPEQDGLVDSFVAELLAPAPPERSRILGVARALLAFADPGFRAGLVARLEDVERDATATAGFEGDVVAVVGSLPEERVVLGGPRTTRYAAPAALVIDLGGDDEYARAAVVDSEDMLASVVLDLRGDDAYVTEAPGPAYAAGGVALLVDVAGEDRYESAGLGQGSSLRGFAMLLDERGDDVYTLQDYGQGHGTCGVGLLYDLEGDDAYTAWAFAQGGGIGLGFSALVDGAGSDTYLADLVWPDVYGDSGPESHHGASQGYCTGIRSLDGGAEVAGGIAALVDLGRGQDRYQSGNFSQGGGYYFSFGLMYDGGGDDENRGYRYSQGFGVHQAVGVRWDAGGDDSYACRSVAHAGMAWDEGVGWFLEDEGDDRYEVGGLALGGAAQTGVAVFLDRDGRDTYRSAGQSRGGTGGSEYHDKPSLGVMIDLGGDRDDHGESDRGDDRFLSTDGVGIFLDLDARTPGRALRSRLLRE